MPTLREHNATPVLLGFGISKPKHVLAAIVAGADGAITGSAIVRMIAARTEEIVAAQERAGAPALQATAPGVNQPLAELCAPLRAFFPSMCAATPQA